MSTVPVDDGANAEESVSDRSPGMQFGSGALAIVVMSAVMFLIITVFQSYAANIEWWHLFGNRPVPASTATALGLFRVPVGEAYAWLAVAAVTVIALGNAAPLTNEMSGDSNPNNDKQLQLFVRKSLRYGCWAGAVATLVVSYGAAVDAWDTTATQAPFIHAGKAFGATLLPLSLGLIVASGALLLSLTLRVIPERLQHKPSLTIEIIQKKYADWDWVIPSWAAWLPEVSTVLVALLVAGFRLAFGPWHTTWAQRATALLVVAALYLIYLELTATFLFFRTERRLMNLRQSRARNLAAMIPVFLAFLFVVFISVVSAKVHSLRFSLRVYLILMTLVFPLILNLISTWRRVAGLGVRAVVRRRMYKRVEHLRRLENLPRGRHQVPKRRDQPRLEKWSPVQVVKSVDDGYLPRRQRR